MLLEKHRALFNLRRGKDAKISDTTIQVGDEDRANRSRVLEVANNVWQARWNSSHKGRTAYPYWNSIEARLKAKWIRPSYYCTQTPTGHGNFYSHLRKFKIVEDEASVCGADRDIVLHLLLECRQYDSQREAGRCTVFRANSRGLFTVCRLLRRGTVVEKTRNRQ